MRTLVAFAGIGILAVIGAHTTVGKDRRSRQGNANTKSAEHFSHFKRLLDTDGDGTISKDEITRALRSLNKASQSPKKKRAKYSPSWERPKPDYVEDIYETSGGVPTIDVTIKLDNGNRHAVKVYSTIPGSSLHPSDATELDVQQDIGGWVGSHYYVPLDAAFKTGPIPVRYMALFHWDSINSEWDYVDYCPFYPHDFYSPRAIQIMKRRRVLKKKWKLNKNQKER